MRSIDELAKACTPAEPEAGVAGELKMDDAMIEKFLDKIANRVIDRLSNAQESKEDAKTDEPQTEPENIDNTDEGGEDDG